MCGRYATTRTAADLSKLFEAFDETAGVLAPDYNLAPTDPAPIVRVDAEREQRVLSVARWGLLPSWADTPRIGARMINARAETVASTRAYAPSFAVQRCLVPADGWFEWALLDGIKKPHFMARSVMKRNDGMTLDDGFAFAGLWVESRFGLSYSIITTAAIGDLAKIHDRMPLLLEVDRWEEWLTAPADPILLTPPSGTYLASIEIRPVGPAVGNVRNDGPELIRPVSDGGIQESLF